MKFIEWLEKSGKAPLPKKEEKKAKSRGRPKKSALKETIKDIETEKAQDIERDLAVSENKHIDPETGKEYKTAAALKAAITRRNKKRG
jgi:hypothetical protein